MLENKFDVTKFSVVDDKELREIGGGVIPLVVWGIWAAAAGAGLTGGITVGLNYVNRTK